MVHSVCCAFPPFFSSFFLSWLALLLLITAVMADLKFEIFFSHVVIYFFNSLLVHRDQVVSSNMFLLKILRKTEEK